jgi:predicted esterase
MSLARAVSLTIIAAVASRLDSQVHEGRGRLQERVVAASDTSQSYALYLPPGYSTARTWPVLFVLDPRGRALLAEKLFEPEAARLGWIVMSSYNTLSDGPAQPNVTAMNAMLASAQSLSVDPSRMYLAGFSGTARVALQFAAMLRGHVAGVFAAGGGLGVGGFGETELTFGGDSTFAVFGAAGTWDFNYEEVFDMGDRLLALRVPHRIEAFEGPHSWPPAGMCGDALEWLELRAMLGGLRPVDSSFVRTRLAAELTHAAELAAHGHSAEAWHLNEAIARDYAQWPEARAAMGRAAALRDDPSVARYKTEAHRLAELSIRQGAELQRTLTHERDQREPSTLEKLTNGLHIAELQRRIERGDSLEASSARRELARVYVWLAFYEPRFYLASGAPDAPARALRMFEAAVSIGPIRGEGCDLLREALPAATPEQRDRLRGQCAETP